MLSILYLDPSTINHEFPNPSQLTLDSAASLLLLINATLFPTKHPSAAQLRFSLLSSGYPAGDQSTTFQRCFRIDGEMKIRAERLGKISSNRNRSQGRFRNECPSACVKIACSSDMWQVGIFPRFGREPIASRALASKLYPHQSLGFLP